MISFSWGLAGAVAVMLAVGQVVVLGSDVSSANHDENQNIKLKNNNTSTLSLCKKPLWCEAGIFAVTNDGLCQPEGVYIVLF